MGVAGGEISAITVYDQLSLYPVLAHNGKISA